MAYDYKEELKKVTDYYAGDPLQKRFSALVTGETNAGKTYMLRTARKPVHIDSFDPGGTKCLRDLIESGDIIADTQWEADDPFNPKVFANWMRATDLRFQIGYFEQFGTYCIDSATTFGEAIMNYQLGSQGRSGESPRMRQDYMPQKTYMTNYIKKLMRLPCDFILTGHLREIKKLIRVDTKTGISTEEIKYRFYTTGQAVVTIPLLFDEIYVILGEAGREGPRRKMLIDSLGEYVARSRLKAKGLLNSVEEPDIKAILKKIGMDYQDKPKLVIE
ncbi:MAG: AAA family ATPase [Candidatus Thorarchaeota archaeon]